MCVCVCVHLSVCLSVYSSVCLCLSVHLFVLLSICLSVCLFPTLSPHPQPPSSAPLSPPQPPSAPPPPADPSSRVAFALLIQRAASTRVMRLFNLRLNTVMKINPPINPCNIAIKCLCSANIFAIATQNKVPWRGTLFVSAMFEVNFGDLSHKFRSAY